MCVDYLILYARIDKPIAFIDKETSVQGVEFYEY